MVGGRWKPTRIEMAEDWYLVGVRADDLPACGWDLIGDLMPSRRLRCWHLQSEG